MTDQQKKAVEEAKELYWKKQDGVAAIDFEAGMMEILNNPEKYGLVTFQDYKQAVNERREANEDLRAERKENAHLRAALRNIHKSAQEALNNPTLN